MIDTFDNWLNKTENLNLFVGIETVIALLALICLAFFMKRVGRLDERTIVIRYKVVSAMFYTLCLVNAAFFSLVSSDVQNFRQLFSVGIVATVVVGALASMYYARKTEV